MLYKPWQINAHYNFVKNVLKKKFKFIQFDNNLCLYTKNKHIYNAISGIRIN